MGPRCPSRSSEFGRREQISVGSLRRSVENVGAAAVRRHRHRRRGRLRRGRRHPTPEIQLTLSKLPLDIFDVHSLCPQQLRTK